MPRYYFKCYGKPDCGKTTSVLRPPEKAREPLNCPDCGSPMKRDPRGASSRIVETRDNGIMSRRVEQIADVERIMWERSRKPEDRDP